MTLQIVDPAIFELLKGLTTGDKVFPLEAPQGEVGPFIIFTCVTNNDRWRSGNGPSGVAQDSFRIDCYAVDYYAARALAAQVEETLDGYTGTVYYGTNSPRDSVRITGVSLQVGFDLKDKTDEPALYRSSKTYLVTYHQR